MRNARTILKVLGWVWVVLVLPFAWISIQVIEQLPRKGFPQNLYDATLGFLFLPGWPIILTCSVLGVLLLATFTVGIVALRRKEDEIPASAALGSTITTNTVRDNQGAASQIGSTSSAMIIQNSPGVIIHPPPLQADTHTLVVERQKALLHRYLNSVVVKNKDLNPTGIHQSQALLSVNVPLDDIFIHIRTVSDRPVFDIGIEQQQLLEEIEQVRRRFDLDLHEREDYIQRLRATMWHSQLGEELLMTRRGEDVTIENVLKRLTPARPAVVLLGSPGSGKSTTMRWLALRMAHASCHSDEQVPQDLAPVQIPIFLTIGDYAKAISASSSAAQQITSVKEFFYNEWKKISPDLPTLLEDELLKGHCLLLFDGLDEVASDSLRNRVRKDLYDFISLYQSQEYNRILITSRIVGYDPGPFAPFARYTLLDLDEEQIQRFLTTWCPAVEYYQARSLQGMQEALTPQQEQHVQQEGRSQCNRLLEALRGNPGLLRLAVNPLMLTILALIQKSGRQLPHRRIELYQTVTLTLLNNWNQFRGSVIFSSEEIDLAEEVLSELAYQLHSRDLPLTEKAVFAVTRETMARFYHRTPEQIQLSAVETFINTLRSSSSLFVERGQGLYGFLHRTFQEYYVMRYLVDTQHYPLVDKQLTIGEDLKAFVRRKCHISIWHEPLLLLIAYKSEQKNRDERQEATALIETILATNESYDTFLQRHWRLAASALIDCNTWYIDILLQQKVANQFFDIYGDPYGTGRYTELQKDIEKIFLLWLRSQPQGSSQQPPLLETWHTALCDSTRAQRQHGAARLLASIAPDLPTCPAAVLHILVPPLLHLAGVQDWYEQELTCPPAIRSRLFTISARPSSPDIEDYALVALRLLDAHGPAGWLHTDWLMWNEEQPDLLQRLTQHGLELNALLTPATIPGNLRDDPNWPRQFNMSVTWGGLVPPAFGSWQTSMLQASSTARYPQSLLFKRLLKSEHTAPLSAWQEIWDRILLQEMQHGHAATYQTCFLMRLLLARKNQQQQQLLASDLLQALVTQRTQVQAMKTLSNLYMIYPISGRWTSIWSTMQEIFGMGAIRRWLVVRSTTKMPEMLKMKEEHNIRDIRDIRDIRCMLDLYDMIDIRIFKNMISFNEMLHLLEVEKIKGMQDLGQLLQILYSNLLKTKAEAVLPGLFAINSLLIHLDQVSYSNLLKTEAEAVLPGLFATNSLLNLLKTEAEAVLPGLFATNSLLIHLDQVPLQITQQVLQTITTLVNHDPSAEQKQLIHLIRQHLSGVQTAHPMLRPLPSSTPDQRTLHLYALQQHQSILNMSSCEEMLAACTDTRKTTKETWVRLIQDHRQWEKEGGKEGGSVGEFAWQMLSQAWSMDKTAQQTVTRALDDDNPLICVAAALLLQHGKDLEMETKQAAGSAIMRILANEEQSPHPIDPPVLGPRLWRLDDMLFETLSVLAEGEL